MDDTGITSNPLQIKMAKRSLYLFQIYAIYENFHSHSLYTFQ